MGKNINTLGLWGRYKVCRCWAEQGWAACSVADLDGWFASDVRDQEVHGDVLAVYVLVHHIPDGLGHHVGVQVGVVLQKHIHTGECMNDTAMRQQKGRFSWRFFVCFLEDGEYRFWPYGRMQLLSGPWRAHRSSWSCRARTDGWRPTHDTSQGNPRCDLWLHATLCETPPNTKSAESLIFNQLIKTDWAELINVSRLCYFFYEL